MKTSQPQILMILLLVLLTIG